MGERSSKHKRNSPAVESNHTASFERDGAAEDQANKSNPIPSNHGDNEEHPEETLSPKERKRKKRRQIRRKIRDEIGFAISNSVSSLSF